MEKSKVCSYASQFSFLYFKILQKDFEQELGVEKNMDRETWAKDFWCWARACIIYMMEFMFLCKHDTVQYERK